MLFQLHIADAPKRFRLALIAIQDRKVRFKASQFHTNRAAHRTMRGSKKRILELMRMQKCDYDKGVHWEPIRLCILLFVMAYIWAPQRAVAQQQPVAVVTNQGLPDAPGFSESSAPGADGVTSQQATATISGTVLDPNGSEVQGARVELTPRIGADIRVLQTDNDGEFTFTRLPPGSFRLTVTGPGMGTFVLPDIKLHAGDFRIVSQIVLPIAAASTEVRVFADRDQLAEEQVHIAVQQRVLGVFPNFYSSYDWNAPPMGPKQKFQLALRAMIDPMAFAGAAGVAGAEQYYDIFPGYGGGIEGYAKRYGAAYANDFSGRMFSSAIFPSIFHQDPRYFYKGSGSIRSRALYAMSAAFIARGDNGRWQPNYSEILGNFAAGALSNLYYPSASRGMSLTIGNGLIETAGRAGTNLVREFLLKRLTSKVPDYANGKP